MAIPAEMFGKGGLGFDYLRLSRNDGSFDWISYAVLVGILNGCPKPRTNIQKYIDQGSKPEVAARIYINEHLPLNFWWSWILDRIKKKNATLYNDLIVYTESLLKETMFETDNVPENFATEPVRLLATDLAYQLALALHHRLTSPKHSKHDLTGVIDIVDELIESSVDFKTFVQSILQVLSVSHPIHPVATS